MEGEDSFSLQERAEIWNLMCAVAYKLGYPLSPVVTSSFIYLSTFVKYADRAKQPSLFDSAIAAMLIAIKTDSYGASVDRLITGFLRQAQKMSKESHAITGYKYGVLAKTDDLNFQRIFQKVASDIVQYEINILVTINWSFVLDQPMSPLYLWLDQMKQYTGDKHNEFRNRCIEAFCQMFILSRYSNDEYRDLAAAAIEHSLQLVDVPRLGTGKLWIEAVHAQFNADRALQFSQSLQHFACLVPRKAE